MGYDIESYWSRVASAIGKRGAGNYLAGDDDPYFRYKRAKFLSRFLARLPVTGRRVLELGCGPGGNLLELTRREPASMVGIDISAKMLDLARQTLAHARVPVELKKTDGQDLPLASRSVDLSLTVTVLQHNVDPAAFSRIVGELCRVTTDRIVIMEDTGTARGAPEGATYIRRPIDVYRTEFATHGFSLLSKTYLNLRYSRRVHETLRRRLVPSTHHEGQPLPVGTRMAMTFALAVTRLLDSSRSDSEDLTKMIFVRDQRGPEAHERDPGDG
jgi:SAM-dependent methyltransferase